MALPVMVTGRSSSGKTYSLKNFKPDEVGILSIEKGRLPFKTDLKVARVPKSFSPDTVKQIVEDLGGTYSGGQIDDFRRMNAARYAWIERVIKTSKTKSLVIDDSQYLLVNEMFDRSGERGYDKFTDMAKNFRNLIHFVNELEDDDKIVYFLHHSEADSDGREKVKTIGKMLDEKLTVEGCFDIVLYCADHEFWTQSNGTSTAKSPEGMFEIKIPNDLKAVDTTIREYYGMKPLAGS